jgi:hypothetical protein
MRHSQSGTSYPFSERQQRLALDLSEAAAVAEGESPFTYSVHVYDPDWLRGRREIESFFIGAGLCSAAHLSPVASSTRD